MLFVMDVGMVFQRLQMSRDFGGHPRIDRQTFFENSCQAVDLADQNNKYFDDLPVSGGSKGNAVLWNG